jgi:hypothetical protein
MLRQAAGPSWAVALYRWSRPEPRRQFEAGGSMTRLSLSNALAIQAMRCPRDTSAAVSEPFGSVATEIGEVLR